MELENADLRQDIQRLIDVTGKRVDVLVDGTQVGVVVRDVQLPPGTYDREACDVLLRTDIQYPLSSMDMFWVLPRLLLADGHQPAGASDEEAFGETWRRFSWHRNTDWVPGRDGLLGHFDFAIARLLRPE